MANKTTAKSIITKQKEAIRLISNASYRAHTKELFLKLKILPFEKLILLERQKFMHKLYNKNQPLSFDDLWITNANQNPTLTLRNANNYFIPPHNNELFLRCPLITFAKAWNDAIDTKFNPSLQVFLKEQSNHYLSELRNE